MSLQGWKACCSAYTLVKLETLSPQLRAAAALSAYTQPATGVSNTSYSTRLNQKPSCRHAAVCKLKSSKQHRLRQAGRQTAPFLPADPSPLTLSLLPLSTPGGPFRLIFLVRRTLPSPPQVLQGVALSPAPSQSGHVDICKHP